MIEWRRVALSFPCMTCGAAPGKPCISTGGREKYEIHQNRTTTAGNHGWRDPDESVPRGADVEHSPLTPTRHEEW